MSFKRIAAFDGVIVPKYDLTDSKYPVMAGLMQGTCAECLDVRICDKFGNLITHRRFDNDKWCAGSGNIPIIYNYMCPGCGAMAGIGYLEKTKHCEEIRYLTRHTTPAGQRCDHSFEPISMLYENGKTIVRLKLQEEAQP